MLRPVSHPVQDQKGAERGDCGLGAVLQLQGEVCGLPRVLGVGGGLLVEGHRLQKLRQTVRVLDQDRQVRGRQLDGGGADLRSGQLPEGPFWSGAAGQGHHTSQRQKEKGSSFHGDDLLSCPICLYEFRRWEEKKVPGSRPKYTGFWRKTALWKGQPLTSGRKSCKMSTL